MKYLHSENARCPVGCINASLKFHTMHLLRNLRQTSSIFAQRMVRLRTLLVHVAKLLCSY